MNQIRIERSANDEQELQELYQSLIILQSVIADKEVALAQNYHAQVGAHRLDGRSIMEEGTSRLLPLREHPRCEPPPTTTTRRRRPRRYAASNC